MEGNQVLGYQARQTGQGLGTGGPWLLTTCWQGLPLLFAEFTQAAGQGGACAGTSGSPGTLTQVEALRRRGLGKSGEAPLSGGSHRLPQPELAQACCHRA